MEHEEGPHGEGEDDEPESSSWLHPDDRLWRHPSEVRSNPPLVPQPQRALLTRLARGSQGRIWLVGVVSGVLGALVAVGVLAATGEVGKQQQYITTKTTTSPAPSDPRDNPSAPDLIGTLATVDPSIVGVTVNGPNGVASGSGVIVPATAAGNASYIVTDASLFAGSGPNSQTEVTTDWDLNFPATLVGTDPASGVALVKAVLQPSKDVNAANLGSVANIQTGELVQMVGSLPEAASDNASNFATGYINDTVSFFQPLNGSSDAMFSMLVANFALPEGSPDYGGAVVDSNGNVLGVAIYVQGAQDDLTYVAPIDTVMAEVTAMLKNGQPGAYPWLGVLQATDLSGPAAEAMGLTGGVQVEAVASGSPVARAGVQDNDVITAIGGRALPSVGALIEWLANVKPGNVVTMNWLHGDQRRAAAITLGAQPVSATPS
ncbi:MAG TPA: trypsin-like peptidase domain-containing protein [Acidimicrobiales bacterium]|nr:trypsin-like peptidase domain-containing protein [Acidimicrobiales bacterium]